MKFRYIYPGRTSWCATRKFALVLCCLALLAGCGKPGGKTAPTTDVPEPGVLFTVSIEPIPATPAKNLIENGDFSAWQAGAAAPDFFLPPDPDRGFSTLAPAEGKSPESNGVKQVWNASDNIESFTKVFRCWLTNLRANTHYRLTVTVNNPSPKEILLRAFQYNTRSAAEAENATEVPETLAGIAVARTEGFEEFSTDFKTGSQEVFCVLLAPKLRSADVAFPTDCVWDSWKLTEVVGAPEPPAQ